MCTFGKFPSWLSTVFENETTKKYLEMLYRISEAWPTTALGVWYFWTIYKSVLDIAIKRTYYCTREHRILFLPLISPLAFAPSLSSKLIMLVHHCQVARGTSQPQFPEVLFIYLQKGSAMQYSCSTYAS